MLLDRSAELIRSAREDIGMSQTDLVRAFGSAVRGEDTEHSDIDLLVALSPDASLFDLGGFADAVEQMTGFAVDLLTDDQTDDEHFAHVLQQAVPL